MLHNFIKITFRNIASHKVFTSINIFGLAIGIACALLISVYVIHELSYDNFHKDPDRLLRVSLQGVFNGVDLNGAISPSPLAKAMVDEIDGVEEATRMVRLGSWLVSNGEVKDHEDELLFADANFFRVFDFEILSGNPDSALLLPRSIILTESSAIKYFGTTDVIGEELSLEVDNKYFLVTAVLKDIPRNSHMHFDMLASLSTYKKYDSIGWLINSFFTYFRIGEGVNQDSVEAQLNSLVHRKAEPELQETLGLTLEEFFAEGNYIQYVVQPIRKIHLFSNLDVELEPNGNAIYVYTFGVIALLILIIGCLNFINLATANSTNRAHEVALRKVVGANRERLILQFITESIIFSLLALLFALIFTELIVPYFNKVLFLDLNLDVFHNLKSLLIIIAGSVLVGIFAGSYPAFFISSFKPVRVLHGILKQGLKSNRVRSVFIILQFFVSILIITITIIVFCQVRYMLDMDLGFHKEHVVVIRRPDALKDRLNEFKQEILENKNVISTTNSTTIPGRIFNGSTLVYTVDSVDRNMIAFQVYAKHDFGKTYGLKLLQGRFISEDIPRDTIACVINEAAVREMGVENPIGMVIRQPMMHKKKSGEYRVVGVVKDFHFHTVERKIEPLLITMMKGNWEGYLNVRVKPLQMKKTLSYLEQTWDTYTTEYPFNYFFLEKDLNSHYNPYILTQRLMIIFSILAVFVACLGLYGLISFTTNQSTREIGLRKALGASVPQLIFFQIKNTFYLVILSTVPAWFAAFLLSNWWLKDFHNRIGFNPVHYLIPTSIVLCIAITTVFFQASKAAHRVPGEALNYE